MATEHLDLPDGQWAELRTSPSHGQFVEIMSAFERASMGRATMTEWASTVGQQMTMAWSVRGEDGQPLDLEDWRDAPAEVVDAICTRAQELWRDWQKSRRPKATRPPRLAADAPGPSPTNGSSSAVT